jgi:hypothetical protein
MYTYLRFHICVSKVPFRYVRMHCARSPQHEEGNGAYRNLRGGRKNLRNFRKTILLDLLHEFYLVLDRNIIVISIERTFVL